MFYAMGAHSAVATKHAQPKPPKLAKPAKPAKPARTRRNRLWWVVAAVLFATLGVVVWLTWRAAQAADDHIEVSTVVSLEKQIGGSGSDTFTSGADGVCFGIGKYVDLHAGTVVRVYGDAHQLLSMSTLSAGTPLGEGEQQACVWGAAAMVRGSEDFYTVQVNDFDPVTGQASDIVDERLDIAQVMQ
jgi:hypothetical protein